MLRSVALSTVVAIPAALLVTVMNETPVGLMASH